MNHKGLCDKATLNFLSRVQEVIARCVKLTPLSVEEVENICGLDVAYSNEMACAASVVWNNYKKEVVEVSTYIAQPCFPYIPGYLFMREAPLMIESLNRLKKLPDLLLVDGHGLAHPRKAGLAVFIGVLMDKPTLGVAKSLLTGKVGKYSGNFAPIIVDGLKVGYVVKSEGAKPYYVSPGHRVTVKDILKFIRYIGVDYPKVLKEAHRISKEGLRKV
ncbi:MAG: endonuclease V [Nitrososphaerales archaeon]|nr:endonuclease V [Nitrososphaerales archaeon]